MKYDATLKKLFQRPPDRLLSHVLGVKIVVKQILPTDLITVENLHPDLLFETEDGELIHAELHGYHSMDEFACRNLLYFGLVLRDYRRPPTQIVFWIGAGNIGVTNGLDFKRLHYEYPVIDLRQLDGEFLLESPEVSETIFAILCKLRDVRRAVPHILQRIRRLPVSEQRQSVSQLLVLSGLRGLTEFVKTEVARMPVSIDLRENEYFEGIYQEGRREAVRNLLIKLLRQKFGPTPDALKPRIEAADAETLERWIERCALRASLAEVFDE